MSQGRELESNPLDDLQSLSDDERFQIRRTRTFFGLSHFLKETTS